MTMTSYPPADHFAILRRLEWAKVLAEVHAQPTQPERHTVLRRGPRPEIPTHVRIAVYLRDQRRCTICRRDLTGQTKHLDHVHPWSALGGDRSHNLRTACPECNQARSNFHDSAAPATPATWWCTDCWSIDFTRSSPWTDAYGEPRWRELACPPIEPDHVDLVLAFCAYCRTLGYTTTDRLI